MQHYTALFLSVWTAATLLLSSVQADTDASTTTRSSQNPVYTGNWDVPYIRQTDYPHIGYSACGPTSVAMLLNYFYPNARIKMPEVYHTGTQTYNYWGPAHGYRNVGFADGDSEFAGVNQNYYRPDSGRGWYSGMELPAMKHYLDKIWGFSVIPREGYSTLNKREVYQAIQHSPLLGRVYAHGNRSWGHYVVIRGINYGADGQPMTADDRIYLNDPYEYWSEDDTSGHNKAVSYQHFFGSGTSHGRHWFRGAVQLIPSEKSAAERQYTVVVDTGHHDANSPPDNHWFHLDDRQAWQFYLNDGGDWFYPTVPNRAARWTPRLAKSGFYQILTKFRADNVSGTVNYAIHDANHNLVKNPVAVSHYSPTGQWTYKVLADAAHLSQGRPYVRATEVPADTNIDAIKFKYIQGWSGNGSILSYHARQGLDANATDYSGGNAYGVKRDIAYLHPGMPVAFFQWQVDTRHCPQLKLSVANTAIQARARPDITMKYWSSAHEDVVFEDVRLPFVIGAANTGFHFDAGAQNWYVLAVAFADINGKGTRLNATCTNEAATIHPRTANKPVILNGGYQWQGNGSLISQLFQHHDWTPDFAIDWPYGVFQDLVRIHPKSTRPVVYFQWQASTVCNRLTLNVSATRGHLPAKARQVKVAYKTWNSPDYLREDAVTLPHTFDNPNYEADPWLAVQVAFDHPATKALDVTAECDVAQ